MISAIGPSPANGDKGVVPVSGGYPGPAPGRGWGKWVSLLAYGLFIETVQRFLPYREFSGWDLVADGIGIWLYVSGARLAMSVRTGRIRP